MPTSLGSGTITLASSTETNFMAADTSNKVYVLKADLSTMVGGDVVVLRIYTKAKPGGTERIAFQQTFTGVQSPDPIWYSDPIPEDVSFRATIQATTGGLHSYDWDIITIP